MSLKLIPPIIIMDELIFKMMNDLSCVDRND